MASLPDNEATRLTVLESYDILDTPRESDFDEIVEIAAALVDVPIAYISFIDSTRLWFKSSLGFKLDEIPRPVTYCQFVVAGDRPVLIEDTLTDTSVVPLVHGDTGPPSIGMPGEERPVRFYLGVPLRAREGVALGTLCVLDYEPRTLPARRIELLEKLSRQVTRQLELRRSAIRLKEEGETFSRLFDTAPTPLVLVYRERIVRVNESFTALLHRDSPRELEDVPVGTLLPAVRDDDLSGELMLVDGDRRIPVLLRRSSLHRNGEPYELLGVIDLTDRNEKERVLREQRTQAENANRIKDSFLSLVSHDLKSPLSGILTVLDLLASAGDRVSEEYKERAIRDMRSSAALLVEMINQLLNIHRLQTGSMDVYREPVNVAETATRIYTSLAKQIEDKNLRTEVESREAGPLLADPGLFREALFNLISNAVKFSPEGGRILVRVERNRVIVEDEGAGIPAEDVPGLFRHEVKTSRPGTAGEPGTGLGLPLTMDIMRAHGGTVLLEPDPPTRFILDFSHPEDAQAARMS